MATIAQHTLSQIADAIGDSESIQEELAELNSSTQSGLTQDEAGRRHPENKGNPRRCTYSLDVSRASQSLAAATDANLIRRLCTSDVDAFETLVRLNRGRMLATARRLLRSEHEAEDAVQDALLAAYRAIHLFAGNSMLSTWLHRLVVNCSLMRLRSKRRTPETPITNLLLHLKATGQWADPRLSLPETGEAVFESNQTRAMVRACIARLPAPYRAILILRDLEELDTNEAAKLLGISVNTAKIRLHRARRVLKMLIERQSSSE